METDAQSVNGIKSTADLEILSPILYGKHTKSTATYMIIAQQNIKMVRRKYLSFAENTENFFSAQIII